MAIVDSTKFIIGIAFAVIGAGILLSSRRTRGFGQRKQAGALMLVASVIFLAIGTGYLDL